MRLIIDGDIVAFTAAVREPEDLEAAKKGADKLVTDIIEACWCEPSDAEMYIKGDGNFRMDHSDYKAVRVGTVDKRPASLGPLRDYLTEKDYCLPAHGAEADDYCVAAAQDALSAGEEYIIATIDKDLLQMEGMHYNIRRCDLTTVTPEDGYYFLLQQTLTGDSVDGIQGLKGIGPKKAQKLLDTFPDNREQEIARKYYSVYGDDLVEGLPSWKYELEKCWNLVYMRRSLDDLKLLPLPPEFRL